MKSCLALVALLCTFLLLRTCVHHRQVERMRQFLAPTSPAVAAAPSSQRAAPVPAAIPDIPLPSEQLSTCITAIAAQSDPAKLSTLGSRQANPRLKRIIYYLAQARAGGADPGEVIDQAQKGNGSFGTPRAPLVKASLLRNLKICDGLACSTPTTWRGSSGATPLWSDAGRTPGKSPRWTTSCRTLDCFPACATILYNLAYYAAQLVL